MTLPIPSRKEFCDFALFINHREIAQDTKQITKGTALVTALIKIESDPAARGQEPRLARAFRYVLLGRLLARKETEKHAEET